MLPLPSRDQASGKPGSLRNIGCFFLKEELCKLPTGQQCFRALPRYGSSSRLVCQSLLEAFDDFALTAFSSNGYHFRSGLVVHQ